MPPAPSSDRISYGPRRVSGCRGNGRCRDYTRPASDTFGSQCAQDYFCLFAKGLPMKRLTSARRLVPFLTRVTFPDVPCPFSQPSAEHERGPIGENGTGDANWLGVRDSCRERRAQRAGRSLEPGRPAGERSEASDVGWEAGIRTPRPWSRAMCPTVGRPPSMESLAVGRTMNYSCGIRARATSATT